MSKEELRSMVLLKDLHVENKTHGNKKVKKNHDVSKEDDNRRDQQDNIIESPPWSDLHASLLDQITGKLCSVDQVVFRAVCKGWNDAQYKTKAADSMPWVVRVLQTSYDMLHIQVLLYATPSLCQRYTKPLVLVPRPNVVHDIHLDRFVTSIPSCLDTDHIKITCNYGWILFSIPEGDFCATTFVFYSPLTKKIVVLPRLIHSRGTNCELTTGFSAEPDSPDFVLLVVRHSDRKTISTYCHGQGKWNTKDLNNNLLGLRLLCPSPDIIVVYLRELFFFIHAYGYMTSYNIAHERWKRECVSFNRTNPTSRVRYAFESNGELMLVHCSETFDYGVSRFDWSTRRWLPLNNLNDQTLFVGLNSFYFKPIEEEEPNNLVLPNEIHVLDNSCYNVNDLKGGKLSEACMYWGKCMQVEAHDKSTFWFRPPDNTVAGKH